MTPSSDRLISIEVELSDEMWLFVLEEIIRLDVKPSEFFEMVMCGEVTLPKAEEE